MKMDFFISEPNVGKNAEPLLGFYTYCLRINFELFDH